MKFLFFQISCTIGCSNLSLVVETYPDGVSPVSDRAVRCQEECQECAGGGTAAACCTAAAATQPGSRCCCWNSHDCILIISRGPRPGPSVGQLMETQLFQIGDRR